MTLTSDPTPVLTLAHACGPPSVQTVCFILHSGKMKGRVTVSESICACTLVPQAHKYSYKKKAKEDLTLRQEASVTPIKDGRQMDLKMLKIWL